MIEYTNSLEDITASQLEGFFAEWIQHPDPETHLEILEHSYAVVLAKDVDTDEVVGFVNAISDGVLAAYLPLLEVRPSHQGQGIGSNLVQAICEELADFYMIDAICNPDVESFYKPLGFAPLSGMAKRNYDAQRGRRSGE